MSVRIGGGSRHEASRVSSSHSASASPVAAVWEGPDRLAPWPWVEYVAARGRVRLSASRGRRRL